MRKIYTLYSLLIFSIIITSCNSSKSMYVKGIKLQQAGMYSEASNFYYDALKRDRTNVDASISLKRVGQIILDEKFDNFENSINKGNKKEAIHEYLSAKYFVDKLQKVNVHLKISDEQTYYFKEAKKQYIEQKLNDTNKLLAEDKFIEAKEILNEILKLAPENQEIRDLQGYSIAEPLYRKAMSDYENGKYKKSYYSFNEVLNYKNSRAMKKLSKEKAMFVIVIKPFANASNYYDLDEKLTMKVEELLSNKDNPFLEIVGTQKYKRLLSEKELSNSDNWEKHADKFLNADAVLEVTIIDAVIDNGTLHEERKKGWEKFTVKRKKAETNEIYYETDYNKIYYYEYSRQKRIFISLNSQLKSFDINKVLMTKSFSAKRDDRILYINFDGDKKDLRSGYWKSRKRKSPGDVIGLSNRSISELRNKLSGRRTMKSTISLENEIINELAFSIAKSVDKFNATSK